ncbi:2Fe-2S iron-sulfur cluster-binding protein [Sphingobium sufflavum]|uniref:2Fe-2S iron-sulfur cluster-binding protein n=1 Tax=Sphingobium sufflavum TaxID=1129547 RepID=UPI001F34943B|nr:2Fe-2S iron-sulfur cluster-binding protein [Sphingobium sufflavum]MCE7797521.1 2Fe-2S iron-sulfur cluster-binding protein [Sphingobium sufflavum]
MAALTVTFIETDGTERAIDNVDAGPSLMEVARNSGIAGIMGDCGGACSCATCHVYIDESWLERVGAPDDIEYMMLDMVADVQRDNSRLSCQIRMREELDGLRLTVAPLPGY